MESKIKIKKGQIEDYAVQKTGDETIAGKKNFIINPRVPHTEDSSSVVNLEQMRSEIADSIPETTLQKVLEQGSVASNLSDDLIITGNGIDVKGSISITEEGARLSGSVVALDADDIIQMRASMQTGIHTPSFFVHNPETNTFILNKGELTALTSQEQTKTLIANDVSGKALITKEYLEDALGENMSLDSVLTAGNTSTKNIILEKPSETNDLAISADGFEFANYGTDFDSLTLKWTTPGDGALFGTEIELPKKSGTLAVLEDVSAHGLQEVLSNNNNAVNVGFSIQSANDENSKGKIALEGSGILLAGQSGSVNISGDAGGVNINSGSGQFMLNSLGTSIETNGTSGEDISALTINSHGIKVLFDRNDEGRIDIENESETTIRINNKNVVTEINGQEANDDGHLVLPINLQSVLNEGSLATNIPNIIRIQGDNNNTKGEIRLDNNGINLEGQAGGIKINAFGSNISLDDVDDDSIPKLNIDGWGSSIGFFENTGNSFSSMRISSHGNTSILFDRENQSNLELNAGNSVIINGKNAITEINGQQANHLGEISLTHTLLSLEATLVLTCDKNVNYFANTGGATTWTLPPVSGNTGKQIIIVNKGSGNISLNTDAGNLELFDGAPLNAMPLITGATYGLYCDGVHWVALY